MVTLAALIASNAEEIRARAAARVATRTPHVEAPDEDVKRLLGEIVGRLRCAPAGDAPIDGVARRGALDASAAEVARDYGDVADAVTEVVGALSSMEPCDRRALRQSLADAAASAIAELEARRERSLTGGGAQQLGSLAHELRNRLATATISFNILRKGNLALGGSTGAVLARSLRGLRDIVERALAEARLESGVDRRRRTSVSCLLEEVAAEAAVIAGARGISFTMLPGDRSVDIDVDPHVFTAALGNLIQNAVKFSRACGHVSLHVSATSALVTIEVEDECGGLPVDDLESLLVPFSQRGTDRSGLGLGLAISQKCVVASGGQLRARNIPGKGCVFSVELPRLAPA